MKKGSKQAEDFILKGIIIFIFLFVSVPIFAEEKFVGEDTSTPRVAASQFSGAASAQIPIVVPPGRNGVAPKLVLAYNSYQKNGWVGVGWDLDMGSIQRSIKRGVDYSANDFVARTGGFSSELVSREAEWGMNHYGAKIEGAFSKFFFNSQTGGWELTTKDGTKSYYGTTSDSRQDDLYDSSRVFKWCLDRVEDTNGNYMTVEYEKMPSPENEDTGQIYLKRIEYTGNGSLAPYYYVEFYLEDRTDKPVIMTTQFEVVTSKRLKTIEVGTVSELVRAYRMEYTEGPVTGRALLQSAQQFGNDASVDEDGNVSGEHAFPKISAGWQNDTSDTFTGAFMSNSGFFGYKITSERDVAFPFDYNGDGKTDIFFIRPDSDKACLLKSNGDGTFENVYNSSAYDLAGYRLNSARDRAFAFDYNGDGNSDIFFYRPDSNIAGIMRSNGDDTFENIDYSNSGFYGYNITSERDRAFAFDYDGDGDSDIFFYRPDSNKACVIRSNGDGTFENIYNSNSGFYGYKITSKLDIAFAFDYNGDGYSDIFFYRIDSDRACVISSNGDGSFEKVFYSTSGIGGYHITSARDRAFPLDYNGDGLQDIFLYRPDSNRAGVAQSNGDGTFSEAFFSNSGIAGYKINSKRDRAFAFDYNGDGMSDIFLYRPDSNYCGVARSNGDGTFYPAHLSSNGIGGYKISSKSDRAFPFDYNGNGRNDIFFYRPDSNRAAVVQSGEKFPDLLSILDNGFGGTTEIEYRPSSSYANTLLRFIVHPISKITINDGLDNFSISEFSYAGGLFDYASREFRGFETVIQTNPDGTQLRTWFHQDEWFKGRQYRIESIVPTEIESILSKATLTWDKTFLDEPDNSHAFIKLLQKRTEFYDDVTVYTQENFTYDDTNGHLISRMTSGTDGEDVSTTYHYSNLADWMWRKTREAVLGSASGKVRETYYQYWDDGTGNLRFKEFWLDGQSNPKIEITYDIHGNQKTVIDPRGNPTTTDYDSDTHTYPVKITYPETNGISHIVENEAWDYRFGKVTITKDENSNRSFYEYDEFGRPVMIDSPNGGQVITEYNDDVFPRYAVTKAKEDPSGNTIDAYRYIDGLGRELQTITFGEAGKSVTTRIIYDEMGRKYLTEGPFFSTGVGFPEEPISDYPWQEVFYDYRGRPVEISQPDGEYQTITTTFNYSGLSTTITDPDGARKTEKKDYTGRTQKVIEHADQNDFITEYDYNAAGDLLRVTDHYGNTFRMNYDTLGRKISMTDPDMGFWEYSYDANGNLVSQTDEKQQTIMFLYDNLNRVTSKTYSTSDPTVDYTYDNLSIPNGRGRLYRVSNSKVTTAYNAYDTVGNVTRISKTITEDPTIYTTRYAYDLSGKVTEAIYPDGFKVTNEYYPGSGLLESVRGGDRSKLLSYISNYTPGGKIGRIESGNSIFTEYAYDPSSTRLLSLKTHKPQIVSVYSAYSPSGIGVIDRSLPMFGIPAPVPSEYFQRKAYKYTPAGNIKEITDEEKGITYAYTYDKLHRLIGETNSGRYDPITYSYNAVGNMISKTVGARAMTYTYDEWYKHAVKTINVNGFDFQYEYDDNGNMISGPDFTDPSQMATRTISYNADNMPVSISHTKAGDTRTTDFIYDGDGVRAKKIVQGLSTTYYIGEHYEIKDGIATKYIFAGNLRIAKVTGADINYYHKDHLGSSTVVVNSRGTQLEATEYLPFGQMRSHTGAEASDYKFTDQEFDAETGLYNYNARLYDPVIGRFISPDSIVQAPFDPQTLNRYSYARNNPLIYTDPSGHFFLGGLDILIGAAIGATVAAIQGENIAEGALKGAISATFFAFAGFTIDYYQITDPILEGVIKGSAIAASNAANDAIFNDGGRPSGYEYTGDYIYYDQVETVEHPDRYYRIDIEYEDPFSINELVEIHQYAKSITKIFKKKVPGIPDIPSIPHEVHRKVKVYQHYHKVRAYYRSHIESGFREELRVVKIPNSEGWTRLSRYEFSESYYTLVTPDSPVHLWIPGRRLTDIVWWEVTNNPGIEKYREKIYPSPY